MSDLTTQTPPAPSAPASEPVAPASPAPSTESAPAPVTTTSVTTGAGGSFDLKGLLDADDDAMQAPAPAEPVVPAAPVVATEKLPAAGAVAPTTEPVAPVVAQPVAPVAPTAPTAPQPTLAEIRKTTREKVKASFSNWTPEQVEMLRTEPEKILPDIAADMMLRTYEAVTGSIMQQLPGYIQGYTSRMTDAKSAESAFTTRWPQLADPKYRGDLVQLAKMHAQMNPDATTEQRIEDVGAMLMVRHKLLGATVPTPAAAPAPQPASRPVAPTRPGTVISTTVEPGPYDALMNAE